MSKTAEKFYKTLKNKVHEVSVIKGFDDEEQQKILISAKKNIITASNQKVAVVQMLRNVNENRATARDLYELVFAIKGQLPDPIGADLGMELDIEEGEPSKKGKEKAPPKAASKASSFPVLPLRSDGDMSEPTEAMYLDVVEKEPDLTDSQLKHIADVVKIMEKEPKLKSEIKRTITEELAKGYINPAQFKRYNQEIENLNTIQEAPQAIRAKKTPKPRAKKSVQSDKAILPIDIGTTSKLPKGKAINDNKKKETKNCCSIRWVVITLK